MTFPDGVLKMKDGQGTTNEKGETSSKSDPTTMALVKEISSQNVIMQQMVSNVSALCASLEGSYQKVVQKLEQHEAKLKTIPRVRGSA